MAVNSGFRVTEIELEVKKRREEIDRIYTCDEAIDLIGTGAYSYGMLAALSVSLLSMAVDMFGFSVVVTGASCDLSLDHTQKSLLISTPFVGPIIMSYVWGYVSDRRGRRWALLAGLWAGLVLSVATAFSTHWVLMAVLKIVGTSFSSAAQSTTYTYLGECVPKRVKGTYTLVMTSALMLFILTYDVPAYFILNLSFRFNIAFTTFVPWRLLALVIAAPLGVSAMMLHFFCESPKFLLGLGKEDEALNCLRVMWTRNGNRGSFPVTKITLNEETRIRSKEESLLTSMLEQALPLFRPPLLWRTLQLFYLTAVIYAINNGLVMWMPIIVEAFTAGLRSRGAGGPSTLCDIIVGYHTNATNNADPPTCISSIDTRTLASGVAHGLIFFTVTLLLSLIGSRRKLLMMTFLLLPLFCSILSVYNENSVGNLVLYVGMISTNFCMGFLFGYYVDLYPTSYRGMASCLGVMVSRAAGLAGVHFIGALVMSHCSATFFAFAGYLLSGVVVAFFLPPDIKRKETR